MLSYFLLFQGKETNFPGINPTLVIQGQVISKSFHSILIEVSCWELLVHRKIAVRNDL